MTVEIIRCEQNSDEWIAARLGIVTASNFATVMASGKAGAESKTRSTYLRKLAGEIITGHPAESFSSVHTERGHAMESEARNFYAFMADVEPELVGFIRNGNKGGSPDSLVGETGLLEIKTALPHILLEYLRMDKFPPEHMAQCQGNLWVAEREWCDILIFWPGMKPLIKRVHRDESYILKMSSAVREFNAELQELVAFHNAYAVQRAA